MKAKTKKATTKNQAFTVGSHEGQIFASVPYTLEDFKNALLIVSILVNVSIFIVWIMTQVHPEYAYYIAWSLVQ